VRLRLKAATWFNLLQGDLYFALLRDPSELRRHAQRDGEIRVLPVAEFAHALARGELV
jgi:hypothetical protein